MSEENLSCLLCTEDQEKARVIFDQIWDDLSNDCSDICFPEVVYWLGGAPGAGKGTITPKIMGVTHVDVEPVVVSSLLNTPDFKKLKDAGVMVGDREVVGLLLKELLKVEYRKGVLVDGFPRTPVQGAILRLLSEKLKEEGLPSSIFKVVVFNVDQGVSVERQMKRGREVQAHNQRVRETGDGELLEERATDLDEGLVLKRYQVFMDETYKTLNSLKDIYTYYEIDASGTIDEVEKIIEATLL